MIFQKTLFITLILAKNTLKLEIILRNRLKYFIKKNPFRKILLHSKVIAKNIRITLDYIKIDPKKNKNPLKNEKIIKSSF